MKNAEEMKLPGVENFWGYLLRQTPIVVFLCVASWLLWQKIEAMESRVDTCNDRMIELYQQQNERLLNVLDVNAEAMQQFGDHLSQNKRTEARRR